MAAIKAFFNFNFLKKKKSASLMLVLSQNKHVYPIKEYFSLTKKYFSHLYRIKTLFKKKIKKN
jgi:hypothetical protein